MLVVNAQLQQRLVSFGQPLPHGLQQIKPKFHAAAAAAVRAVEERAGRGHTWAVTRGVPIWVRSRGMRNDGRASTCHASDLSKCLGGD